MHFEKIAPFLLSPFTVVDIVKADDIVSKTQENKEDHIIHEGYKKGRLRLRSSLSDSIAPDSSLSSSPVGGTPPAGKRHDPDVDMESWWSRFLQGNPGYSMSSTPPPTPERTSTPSPTPKPTSMPPPTPTPTTKPSPICFKNRTNLDGALGAVEAGGSERAGVEAIYGTIETWCFDGITDLSDLLQGRTEFNENISGWNVSQVTNMVNMFGASSFNGDISGWDVSQVTDMNTSSFNGDISGWNVSQVTNMFAMFAFANSFNGDISGWDVSQVTSMGFMFQGASAFDFSLCDWGPKLQGRSVFVAIMFFGSGCPEKGDPDTTLSPVTPLCSVCD